MWFRRQLDIRSWTEWIGQWQRGELRNGGKVCQSKIDLLEDEPREYENAVDLEIRDTAERIRDTFCSWLWWLANREIVDHRHCPTSDVNPQPTNHLDTEL